LIHIGFTEVTRMDKDKLLLSLHQKIFAPSMVSYLGFL